MWGLFRSVQYSKQKSLHENFIAMCRLPFHKSPSQATRELITDLKAIELQLSVALPAAKKTVRVDEINFEVAEAEDKKRNIRFIKEDLRYLLGEREQIDPILFIRTCAVIRQILTKRDMIVTDNEIRAYARDYCSNPGEIKFAGLQRNLAETEISIESDGNPATKKMLVTQHAFRSQTLSHFNIEKNIERQLDSQGKSQDQLTLYISEHQKITVSKAEIEKIVNKVFTNEVAKNNTVNEVLKLSPSATSKEYQDARNKILHDIAALDAAKKACTYWHDWHTNHRLRSDRTSKVNGYMQHLNRLTKKYVELYEHVHERHLTILNNKDYLNAVGEFNAFKARPERSSRARLLAQKNPIAAKKIEELALRAQNFPKKSSLVRLRDHFQSRWGSIKRQFTYAIFTPFLNLLIDTDSFNFLIDGFDVFSDLVRAF